MQQRNDYANSEIPGGLLAFAGEPPMSETLWRCVQTRAGQVLNRVLFNTQAEADRFIAQMHRHEPDIFWHVEPVEASTLWN
jgi:hypothetical protein